MSHLVREALALGFRAICPLDGRRMDVQGQSGRWGHKAGENAYHVLCPEAYGEPHDEGCECAGKPGEEETK